MAFLGLYGAHASGKTTALLRMWEELNDVIIMPDGTPPFTFIFGDNDNAQYRWDDGTKLIIPRTKGRSPWKSTAEIKRGLVSECVADDSRVFVVESARSSDVHVGIANAFREYGGGAYVVFVTLSWDTIKHFIVERCKSRDKEFRADYWTPKRLHYEGSGRYLNQATKSLRPVGVPYHVYEIDEHREAWADVEAHIWDLLERPLEAWYA